MPTAEVTNARGYSYTESVADHVVSARVPPIASTEPASDADTFLGEQAWDEYFFQPAEQNDPHQILRGSGSQGMMITGSVVMATLALGVLAYFFWPAAGEKKQVEAAEAAAAVQSEPVAPIEGAARITEPSLPLAGARAVAWPDLPPSGIVGAARQIAAAAPAGNIEMRQTVPTSQNRDIVFLQRPGVNIRSTPSANGTVLGTARKGTRFQVTNREGDWVQVESDRLKGWINSQFLGPNDAR